jgi:hypothetical protein
MKPQHRKSVKSKFFYFTAGICLEKTVELMVSDSGDILQTTLVCCQADKLCLKLEEVGIMNLNL